MEKIRFQPYQLFDTVVDDLSVTYAFGFIPPETVDDDAEFACCKITGFKPYAYIPIVGEYASSYIKCILNKYNRNSPCNYNIVYKKKLFFAHPSKGDDGKIVLNEDGTLKEDLKPYYKVEFNNATQRFFFCRNFPDMFCEEFRISKKKLESPEYLIEEVVDPSLQIFSILDIGNMDMLSLEVKSNTVRRENLRFSKCDVEFNINYLNIKKSKSKGILPVSPVTMCYDIECHNSTKGVFADPTIEDDVCYMISVIIQTSSCTKSFLLSLKEPDSDIVNSIKVKSKVIYCKNETTLLLKFFQLITNWKVNVITGYNIFKFDNNYVLKRCEYLGIDDEFLKLGHLQKYKSKIVTRQWNSGAYGNQKYIYPNSPGLLFIDIYPLIMKEKKFPKYTLKYVSTAILKTDVKDDLTHEEMRVCYMEGTPESMGRIGKYCVQDSNVTLLLYNKLNSWDVTKQMANVVNSSIMDIQTRGQQARMFTLLYRHCTNENIIVETKKYDSGGRKYTGGMVLEPDIGFHQWVATFDFNSLYPLTIISNNIDYTTLIKEEDYNIIPDDMCITISSDGDTYKYLRNKKSVVPNILSILLKSRADTRKIIKANNKEISAIESRIASGSEDVETGNELIKSLKYNNGLLDIEQNTYKVTANSIYGAMGAEEGNLAFIAGAISTTAKGRESIVKLQTFFTDNYNSHIVYGDTDSIMLSFENTPRHDDGNINVPDFIKMLEHAATEATKLFPPPMNLEFENLAVKFLIMSKKMYLSVLTDGNRKEKGLITVRRDHTILSKNVYNDILDLCFSLGDFTFEDVDNIRELLIKKALDVYSRYFNVKDYTLTASIKELSDYKSAQVEEDDAKRQVKFTKKGVTTYEEFKIKSYPAHIQLAIKNTKRGIPYDAGTRMEYLIFDNTTSMNYVSGDQLESVEYYNENTDIMKLNTVKYIEKMVKPIDTLLLARFKVENIMSDVYERIVLHKNTINELNKCFSAQIIYPDE